MKIDKQLAARKRKATLIYTLFGIAAALLCLLIALAPDVPSQVGILLVLGILALIFFTVQRRAGIIGAFAHMREGIILQKEEHYEAQTRLGITGQRIHYTAGKTAIGIGGGALIRTLAMDFDGTVREVQLPTPRHADLYLVGDRILYHAQFITPLLLTDRHAPHRGCAMCGAICPTAEGDSCRTCGAELRLPEQTS